MDRGGAGVWLIALDDVQSLDADQQGGVRGGGYSDMLHFLPFCCYRADRSREVEPVAALKFIKCTRN